MFNQKTKDKIKGVVNQYIKDNPDDYRDLVYVVNEMRKNLTTEMAEIKSTHAIKRALYTLSEDLERMIQGALTAEEKADFIKKENARWFTREFPQFALTQE